MKRVMQGKTAGERWVVGGRQLAPSHSGGQTGWGEEARAGKSSSQEELSTSHWERER